MSTTIEYCDAVAALRNAFSQGEFDNSPWRADIRSLLFGDNEHTSVLQTWVMRQPLRVQGTLLTAVRGCDVTPKYPLDSLERRITAAIRWSFMIPADIREVDIPGAFFSSDIPEPKQLSGIGHYPQHWFSHVWHAVEVLGYLHPDANVRARWEAFYIAMCRDQHTNPEMKYQMLTRLTEDRIASNSVVS